MAISRSQKYAYYQYYNTDYKEYGKSIRKDDIEGAFEKLLRELKPSPALFEMAYAMFSKIWQQTIEIDKDHAIRLKQEQARIERKVSSLLDRTLEAENDSIAKAYEKKASDLEVKKAEMAEKIVKLTKTRPDFKGVFRTAKTTLPFNMLEAFSSMDYGVVGHEDMSLNQLSSEFGPNSKKLIPVDDQIYSELFDEFYRWDAVLQSTSMKLEPPEL